MTKHNRHGSRGPLRTFTAPAAVFAALVALTACGTETTTIAEPDDTATSAPKQVDQPPAVEPEPASDTDTAEAAFLITIDQQGLSLGVSDEDVLTVGYGICDMFDLGMTSTEVLDMAMESGFSAYDSGYLVGAAAQAFCPEYSGEL